jgi:hypothetical protein
VLYFKEDAGIDLDMQRARHVERIRDKNSRLSREAELKRERRGLSNTAEKNQLARENSGIEARKGNRYEVSGERRGQRGLNGFEGKWYAVDLQAGGNPGAPAESIITITKDEIVYDNAGGSFANGKYVVNESNHINQEKGRDAINFHINPEGEMVVHYRFN